MYDDDDDDDDDDAYSRLSPLSWRMGCFRPLRLLQRTVNLQLQSSLTLLSLFRPDDEAGFVIR